MGDSRNNMGKDAATVAGVVGTILVSILATGFKVIKSAIENKEKK